MVRKIFGYFFIILSLVMAWGIIDSSIKYYRGKKTFEKMQKEVLLEMSGDAFSSRTFQVEDTGCYSHGVAIINAEFLDEKEKSQADIEIVSGKWKGFYKFNKEYSARVGYVKNATLKILKKFDGKIQIMYNACGMKLLAYRFIIFVFSFLFCIFSGLSVFLTFKKYWKI